MATDPLTLEQICATGWPGLQSRRWGDWHGRYGNGFTSRANSVLVVGPPDRDLPEAVDTASRWYADFGLRLKFQIPTGVAVPDSIRATDARLQHDGWRCGDQVSVQTAGIDDALAHCAARPDLTVSVAESPDPHWLASYLYRGAPLGPEAIPVLTAGPAPVFLSVARDDKVVGVGRGVITDGWLGVTAVTVAESARRSGIGTAVMAGLLSWGRTRTAHSVYLQVDRANTVARAMYAGLGFAEHHGYHYLLAPEPPTN